VRFINVIELDENFISIAQQTFNETLSAGDSFDYSSSIKVDDATFPSVIQLDIYGVNAAGDTIVNSLSVSFTNNCSVYPVFEESFSLGWAVFVSSQSTIGVDCVLAFSGCISLKSLIN
jgi:hypothetical protein